MIADTLVNILCGEGHEAIAVSSGQAAVEWAGRFFPDVIVSDIIMPGLNGIETGKAILQLLPNCRVILFSGQAASTDLLANAEQEGYVFEVLAKPVDPEILLALISTAPSNSAP